MIGSISKIRPCGHHHHYKYAHATKTDDVKNVAANYKRDPSDLAEKIWDYPFNNLTNANSLFRDIKTGDIVTVNFYVPNVKGSFDYCFTTDFGHVNGNWKGDGIEVVNLDAPNATSLYILLYMNTNLRKFNMIGDTGKKITALSYMAEGTYNLSDWTNHNFSNVTNIGNAWYGSRSGAKNFKIECDFRKVTSATRAFALQSYLTTMRHAYKEDENGNRVWIPQEYDDEGNAIHPWMYNEFPVLSSGQDMFSSCKLDKESSLSILNSLKDWTGNTSSHPLGIGIQRDYKYDNDINIALKKVGNNYTVPLEYTSNGLPEAVNGNKNWTLTVGWSGYPTANEVINPDIITAMDLNEVSLPVGYKRCIRLIGDSSQFIKTGYVPTNNTGMWGIYSTFSSDSFVPFGVEPKNSNYFHLPQTIGTAKIAYATSSINFTNSAGNTITENGSCAISSTNWLNEKKATVFFNENNNGEVDISNINLDFSSSPELYIFGKRRPDGYKTTFYGAIYRVKISEGTEIVRDFIPCLDASGKPCMRDIINGVDYYNQGTGADFDYEIYT